MHVSCKLTARRCSTLRTGGAAQEVWEVWTHHRLLGDLRKCCAMFYLEAIETESIGREDHSCLTFPLLSRDANITTEFWI